MRWSGFHRRTGEAKLRRNEAGAAAAEFAVVAPIFIFFGLGIIAYAIYFGAAHSVQQLAADAARSSVAGLSASERQSIVLGFIGRNKEPQARGFWLTGIILGFVSIAIAIIYWIILAIIFASFANTYNTY